MPFRLDPPVVDDARVNNDNDDGPGENDGKPIKLGTSEIVVGYLSVHGKQTWRGVRTRAYSVIGTPTDERLDANNTEGNNG